jgi:hypothetical protein
VAGAHLRNHSQFGHGEAAGDVRVDMLDHSLQSPGGQPTSRGSGASLKVTLNGTRQHGVEIIHRRCWTKQMAPGQAPLPSKGIRWPSQVVASGAAIVTQPPFRWIWHRTLPQLSDAAVGHLLVQG